MSAPDPLAPGRHGAPGPDPVSIARAPRGVVQVQARKGRAADLAARLQSGLGLALPAAGHSATAGDLTAIWFQPDGWMLLAPAGIEGAFVRRVKDAAGDAGSVVDQTHGRSVITVAGPRAAWVLNKLVRIDLHPSAFPPGRATSAPAAGLACTLRRTEDGFELVVFTTFLRSFAALLTHAADETGYVVA